MLEIPEAVTAAAQINKTAAGKRILNVIAAHSSHKFAWYSGEPALYNALLSGRSIDAAAAVGGMVQIMAGDSVLLLGDGVSLRFLEFGEPRPEKHQLLIEFEDGTALCASVQMYGGLWCFKDGEFDNPYYILAKEKPSPVTDRFDRHYFETILTRPENAGLSAKALLAAEQRIPGLGNGVLQDILFEARIHPKKKVNTFSQVEKEALYSSVKSVLLRMVESGGRDTEKDLFGNPGGYRTKLSRNTAGKPCPVCGTLIQKEAYMGGSVYFCGNCQKL
ncbi:MAG: Formamidopyrimidine-DNA glycosylase [Firmicutes bacterium ADurb.Bin182]|nr:MAG: Formamidopyrimidine-DNA glycosylase [Firmicutes bacterium ADurb.Bin182]